MKLFVLGRVWGLESGTDAVKESQRVISRLPSRGQSACLELKTATRGPLNEVEVWEAGPACVLRGSSGVVFGLGKWKIHSLWGSLLHAVRFYSERLSGVWLWFKHLSTEKKRPGYDSCHRPDCPSPNGREQTAENVDWVVLTYYVALRSAE